jgi:hypothetical protein
MLTSSSFRKQVEEVNTRLSKIERSEFVSDVTRDFVARVKSFRDDAEVHYGQGKSSEALQRIILAGAYLLVAESSNGSDLDLSRAIDSLLWAPIANDSRGDRAAKGPDGRL